MITSSSLRQIVLLVVVLAFAVHGRVFAQAVGANTGALNGRVTDATASPLPGATVTIAGASLMGTRDTVTTSEGEYRFAAVPPGEYTITFALSGFATVTRQDVRVGLGFTASVNVELGVASLAENVTVSGVSPVIDVQATKVTTNFDAAQLANLPSARDYWSILAEAPALRVARFDVGGSAAGTQTNYTAYGTSAQNRPMVEGINTTEGTGSFALFTDYGANQEVSIVTAAHGADMAVPGVQGQIIVKSGGNTYHGSLYTDYENENWQAHNIDAGQIARGVVGGGGLAAADTNRLAAYSDVNAGLGGYLRKDRVWWFGSVRRVDTQARVTNFPVNPNEIILTNLTAKVTINTTPRNRFVFYAQPSRKNQPNRLDRWRVAATSALHSSENSTFEQENIYRLWKTEYDATLSDNLYLEVRGGQYGYNWPDKGLDLTAPSIEDIGNNQVFGSARHQLQVIRRNQAYGTLSYLKDTPIGTHNLKGGVEIFRESLTTTTYADSYDGGVVQILRNGAPLEVELLEVPSISENGMWAYGAYVNDNWSVTKRLSLNLGLRFDRYRNFLPAQDHAAGRFNPTAIHYEGVNDLLHWNLPAPRLGATFDLAGDGRTVLKANYAKYWWNPGYSLSNTVNPNPAAWSRRYSWTDLNGNDVWDDGEQGQLLASRGGSSQFLDPDLQDTYTREAVFSVEREVARNFGLRTGFVWRGERQQYDTINTNQPFSAFTIPVLLPDPGPDGRTGTADDGQAIQGFGLQPQYIGLAPNNLTTNIPNSDSDYYTWEVTGTRRMSGHWSLLATFANTWMRKSVLPKTPNDLINRDNGRDDYSDWAGKVQGTVETKWDIKLTPVLRYQSGTAYGRGIVSSLNYGNPTILATAVGEDRYPSVTLLDVRVEKVIPIGRLRVSGFADVFNLLNANPEQNLVTTSGTSWLRPTNIVPPRLLRIGAKLEW